MNKKTQIFVVLYFILYTVGCQNNNPESTQPTKTDTVKVVQPIVTKIDIQLNVTSLIFNTPGYGTDSKSFTITNPSTSNADLLVSLVVNKGTYFALSSGVSDYRILSGKNVTIWVSFKTSSPCYMSGHCSASDILSIQHNATTKNSPLQISLTGTW
jgi:hypothetical protein